ncbi:MAG TPA: TIGR03618 family F420-dependent PPOX class oxidoreductase [Dehalococcoidia bacterium]|nr:TIGR03618 family F420-dependent PPOX class oxidoreductase [Dehalococcoidia bacterium]
MRARRAVVTPEQADYLAAHQLCVLGTGRKDGSPQLSTVTYLYDGERLLTSITKDRAKYWNVLRQPRVSVLVPDGRAQVIVYGSGEILEGKARDEAIIAIRAHQGDPLPDDYDLDRFSQRLDELQRVVLSVTPERVLGGE